MLEMHRQPGVPPQSDCQHLHAAAWPFLLRADSVLIVSTHHVPSVPHSDIRRCSRCQFLFNGSLHLPKLLIRISHVLESQYAHLRAGAGAGLRRHTSSGRRKLGSRSVLQLLLPTSRVTILHKNYKPKSGHGGAGEGLRIFKQIFSLSAAHPTICVVPFDRKQEWKSFPNAMFLTLGM